MYGDYDPADNARETGFTSVENIRLDRVLCGFWMSKDFHWQAEEEEGGNPERLLLYVFNVEKRIFSIFVPSPCAC